MMWSIRIWKHWNEVVWKRIIRKDREDQQVCKLPYFDREVVLLDDMLCTEKHYVMDDK